MLEARPVCLLPILLVTHCASSVVIRKLQDAHACPEPTGLQNGDSQSAERKVNLVEYIALLSKKNSCRVVRTLEPQITHHTNEG
jgi:hypothetical protein